MYIATKPDSYCYVRWGIEHTAKRLGSPRSGIPSIRYIKLICSYISKVLCTATPYRASAGMGLQFVHNKVASKPPKSLICPLWHSSSTYVDMRHPSTR